MSLGVTPRGGVGGSRVSGYPSGHGDLVGDTTPMGTPYAYGEEAVHAAGGVASTDVFFPDEGDDLDGDGEGDQGRIDTDGCWAVVSSFFHSHGLVNQQLESFNDFVSYKIQEIIDEHPPIEVR